ncbi:MAG: N-acyl-D-amino-acid deacylase family protein [Luminiphilus sp.]
MTYTLLKGGLVVDGTGAKPLIADVVTRDGKIEAVIPEGEALPPNYPDSDDIEIIDASGCIVTPGFVDPHTHYDGQATWDDRLAPSADHGVTTVVMGNCGVGFAPVKPGEEDFLIALMEGVEDIPGAALADGIEWTWESFPDYLNALDKKPRAIDVVAQLPHGALRTYVLGKANNLNGPATEEQIEQMATLAKEAIAAGAFAFSTNRIAMHTSTAGESVPGTFAEKDEILAIIKGIQQAGANLLQVVPEGLMGENPTAFRDEVQLYKELSLETGCSIVFTLSQNNVQTTLWRELLEEITAANREGAKLWATTGNRPGGMLMSWDTFHIFLDRPSYLEIAHLPLSERVIALLEPERRHRILSEEIQSPLLQNGAQVVRDAMNAIFPCADRQLFEPNPSESLAARLANADDSAEGVLYDAMCEVASSTSGQPGFLHVYMGNYADGDLDAVYDMMMHPHVVVGAADGGAHVNVICDASYTTFMLQHWVRDRERGQKLPLERAVHMLTKMPADLYGLSDRGVIEVGKKADINMISLDTLELNMPYVARDLPTGAPRLLQGAEGYVMTMVNGEITLRNGKDTGARPGGLVRRRVN